MARVSFAHAAIPERFTLMGLTLKPFCLGHVLLMRRYGCAYADTQETLTSPEALIKDFLWALVICSMSYEDFVTALQDDKLTVSVKRLGRPVEKVISFRAWWLKWVKFVTKSAKAERRRKEFNKLLFAVDDLLTVKGWHRLAQFVRNHLPEVKEVFCIPEKLAAFNNYIKEGWQVPKFSTESQGSNSGDWAHAVFLSLTGELGYTESQALNMPLSKAFLNHCRVLERKGSITLLTDEELDEIERLDALRGGQNV
jgi:hypothetical protein